MSNPELTSDVEMSYKDGHQEDTVHPTASSDDDLSSQNEDSAALDDQPLTKKAMMNLFFCVLAWACTICNVTLVAGTSNVVLLSIGGDPNLSSVPLATFFMGASLVSMLVTPWHFQRWGRKVGFLAGVALGFVGSGLGALSVFQSSTPLLIISTAFFGMAMGIGFYLRFAAVEVVPKHWSEKAVTLVVAGGCIAAFAGPESAEGTKGKFGDEENLLYLGVFINTALFNAANVLFTSCVQFPAAGANKAEQSTASSAKSDSNDRQWLQRAFAIIKTRNFLVPMSISALSWIMMAMPMSVFRVAMHQVGYTTRQSLLTIELHFFGMYGPGVFTGRWIAKFGPRAVAMGSVLLYLGSIACLQLAKGIDDETPENISLWIVGMVLIGIGWNCSFSASTVGSTRSYVHCPDCKSVIQAANDGLTFLLAGVFTSSASSIFQAGGEGLDGWRVVNWVVLGFIGLFSSILVLDVAMEKYTVSSEELSATVWSSPSIKVVNQHSTMPTHMNSAKEDVIATVHTGSSTQNQETGDASTSSHVHVC